MAKRGGKVHVAITRRHYKGTEYTTTLLRRSVKEAELLQAMDWLLERQERIEGALARRHLRGEGFVLYDLSSSYVEGRRCELAAVGYSRDGKPSKPHITYGLCCAPSGQLISIQVHPGNTGDPTTLQPAVERVRERFGIEHVVFVDRGMIAEARIKVLKQQGVGLITALRAPQIQKLTVAGGFQLSLFDEQGLCEIASPEFPDERLVVCRNPQMAAERARKRQALLDGLYVLHTHEPASRIGSAAIVRAYKQLKVNEQAFRQMKTPPELRPIHHRLGDRVRAHAFLCMLACYVQFELARRLAPMLFADDTPLSPADPVAPARRSPRATAKVGNARTADGHIAHILEDLLTDLGTLCRNTIRIGNSPYAFTRLTTPTELQTAAYQHIGVKPPAAAAALSRARQHPCASNRDVTVVIADR